MTKLKPIGSVFKINYPPDQTSTDSRGRIFTYRVVAHRLCMRFDDDEIGEMRAELETVSVEYTKPLDEIKFSSLSHFAS